MGEVLMHPMGGGIGSDDVTAAKAHVLTGHSTVTTDSDDEVVEGTMPDRGQWQYAESMGQGSDYYALNQLPEGYYHADGADWAPEVRIKKDVAKRTSMWSDAYSAGVSDADSRVNTNSASYRDGYNNGKWSVKNSGQNVTLTGVHGAYDDYTFTYQGRPGYNGVIFAITGAEYWIYAGAAESSVSDKASISTSYNSSNGVITIHAYRHTKLVGTIYYY